AREHQPRNPLSRRRLLGGAALAAGGVLLGGAADLSAARRADAAVATPRIYTRAEWNARPPSNPIKVLKRKPDQIIVHHTASANSTDYSLDQAFALSHWIQDLHMDRNGWSDAGQQLTISRGGFLMEGRDRSLEAINTGRHVMGAQCAGHNDHTIGIENEGLYMDVDTTPALFDMLVQTCAWLCDAYSLDPHQAIVGHRDYVATLCPGDVLYARLPELRDRVAQAMGA
ncbi:MAG: peptidoglycan recognition protein family protein, partial [Micromonosporaceae bacterium]